MPNSYWTNTNKRAGWNKRAGGNFFSKSINVQTKIRPCRVEFFLKINKRACTSIRYTRVVKVLLSNLYIVIHRCLALKKRQIIKLGANKSTHYVAHTLAQWPISLFLIWNVWKITLFSANNMHQSKYNFIKIKPNRLLFYQNFGSWKFGSVIRKVIWNITRKAFIASISTNFQKYHYQMFWLPIIFSSEKIFYIFDQIK